MVSRILLGLIYTVFGLNGFLQFLPIPPMPEAAQTFMMGLASSGYFFPVLKGTEVLGGLMLLGGVAAPVALVVLAPITLQIFLFHAVLTPGFENLLMPLYMILLHGVSASGYWDRYAPLFRKSSSSSSKSETPSRRPAERIP
jgi:uncharacterized membrane protein YphA (DoxX/SURF4 family)